jgi:hypothetical protein
MNKNNAETALIPTFLCGGAGSRLWPVSREQYPLNHSSSWVTARACCRKPFFVERI